MKKPSTPLAQEKLLNAMKQVEQAQHGARLEKEARELEATLPVPALPPAVMDLPATWVIIRDCDTSSPQFFKGTRFELEAELSELHSANGDTGWSVWQLAGEPKRYSMVTKLVQA